MCDKARRRHSRAKFSPWHCAVMRHSPGNPNDLRHHLSHRPFALSQHPVWPSWLITWEPSATRPASHLTFVTWSPMKPLVWAGGEKAVQLEGNLGPGSHFFWKVLVPSGPAWTAPCRDHSTHDRALLCTPGTVLAGAGDTVQRAQVRQPTGGPRLNSQSL